jgi:hypothetical protein
MLTLERKAESGEERPLQKAKVEPLIYLDPYTKAYTTPK